MNRKCSCRIVAVVILSWIWAGPVIVCEQASGQGHEKESGYLPSTVIINQVCLAGNVVTRPEIILRELEFKRSDTISMNRFPGMVMKSKQNVFNTRLFNFVTIDTIFSSDRLYVDVKITMVERWYAWPVPFFEISDRNFNVWWETRDYQRLTFGVDFTFFNARGRNETLKIMTHFGFNQKYGFSYKIPYVNRKQTLGIGFGSGVELNHELPVFTMNNEPVYIRNNSDYLKKVFSGSGEVSLRPDFFSIHAFRVSYSYYSFDSAIIAIQGFSLSKHESQQFISVGYSYKNDHRDKKYYPLTGYCLEAEVNHTIPYETAHNTYLRTDVRVYLPLIFKWYWASGFTGKLSFDKTQPYFFQRALGYGRDYVRGYEYYVVGGQHFALLKNNLKFAVLPNKVEKIGFIRSEKFNAIPLALYMNAFVDMGYAYNYAAAGSGEQDAGNTLENSFLIGYGIGIDFATYYDIVIRAEVAVNRMQIPGLYLHFIAPI